MGGLGCGGAHAPAPAPPDAGPEVDAGSGVGDAGVVNPTSRYPSPDWDTALPEAVGLDSMALERAAAVAEANDSYCLLVIRHGQLVFERYWAGNTRWSTPPSWSIAKSYASAAVGIALERGDLASLDQPVADFVPAWRGTPREAITLRDLLSMTSGLKWSAFDDYVGLASLSMNNTETALAKPADKTPGASWTYDNGAVQILDEVFRVATGRTIEEYAREHLWRPLGISTNTWKHDPAGNPTAYANVLATCRDHARFGYLLLRRGRWANDAQVIPESYLERALRPSQALNRAYGFLFWLNAETPALDAMMNEWPGRAVPFAPVDLFAARGFGNQFIDVIPSLDLVVVRFGADPMAHFSVVELARDARFTKHDDILLPILQGVLP
ncbi:MAG: serine hydrolase domain-containing protein [Myxococcota bacterium]